jgi:hypothetical protein
MKNLFFISFFSIFNTTLAQSDSLWFIQRIEDHLYANQINNEFKTGDNDAHLVNGLLKNFISDSTVKYQYSRLSPNIGTLRVKINDTTGSSFDEWVKQDFSMYNSDHYYLKYLGTNVEINSNSENLYIYDAHTNSIVRVITIWYSEINPVTKEYMNVISVADTKN